jgi:hypothetical protein
MLTNPTLFIILIMFLLGTQGIMSTELISLPIMEITFHDSWDRKLFCKEQVLKKGKEL